MLPTFVIGLREGLEAALIVGIVAAFLRQRGRLDLIRWVFVGVFSAIALCTAAGIALDLLSRNLPQRQQEGLETVIGVAAVAMVTYMVVWMKRHSRELKGQLDRAAGVAVAAGSGLALEAMAFLAVLREGLETVVFLLAAFNESGSGAVAGLGAVLGILAVRNHPGLLGRHPGLLGRHPGLLGRHPGLLGRHPGLLGRHPGLLGG